MRSRQVIEKDIASISPVVDGTKVLQRLTLEILLDLRDCFGDLRVLGDKLADITSRVSALEAKL